MSEHEVQQALDELHQRNDIRPQPRRAAQNACDVQCNTGPIIWEPVPREIGEELIIERKEFTGDLL